MKAHGVHVNKVIYKGFAVNDFIGIGSVFKTLIYAFDRMKFKAY